MSEIKLPKAQIVKYLRYRKGLFQQDLLWLKNENDASWCGTLSRIENTHQDPHFKNFEKYMENLSMPMDTTYYSFLNNAGVEAYAMEDAATSYLNYAKEDPTALTKAKEIIKKLKALEGFGEWINLQMVQSLSLRVLTLEGHAPQEILTLAEKAFEITFPECKLLDYSGETLFFEESTILHYGAKALAKIDPRAAVSLYEKIIAGVSRMCDDEKHKERRLSILMLDLCELLMDMKDYPQALEICEAGRNISMLRNKGRHVPDFMYNQAIILQATGDTAGVTPLLPPVYFGLMAMGRHKKSHPSAKFCKGHRHKH